MVKRNLIKRIYPILGVLVLIAMLIAFVPPTDVKAAPLPPQILYYALYATDGYWNMADGVPLYSYGFVGGKIGTNISYLQGGSGNLVGPWTVVAPTPGTGGPEMALAGSAQFPAPMIYLGTGDSVYIYLKNLGVTNPNAVANDPHSVHLHGMDVNVANDGVPETSIAAIAAGSPNLVTMPLDPGAGNVVVYAFTASRAGTYFYHCHQEASIHVDMGMMGALIVYNAADAGRTQGPGFAGTAYGGKPYAKDVVLLLNDTDANQHFSEASADGTPFGFNNYTGAAAGTYNPALYKPQYWFINHLSFPNTIHANTGTFNWNNWIAAHPGYDPLITGSVAAQDKILLRFINMGFETHPFHIHGYHPAILGKDQRSWTGFTNNGAMEVNTLTIGSGEAYDLYFNIGTQGVTSTYPQKPDFGLPWGAGTESRYDVATGAPLSNNKVKNPPIPDPLGGNFIGGPVVNGATIAPTITSQIFVAHNHDDYKATNNGAYPGGMFTVILPLP